MPSVKRPRTLNYRLAEHFIALPTRKTLETYLEESIQDYPNRGDRRFQTGDDFLDGLAVRHTDNEGAYIYTVAYTRGDNANAIKHSGTRTLDIVPPPANSDFIDGTIAALVSGNHVFFCSEHLREGSIKKFISEFIKKKSSSHGDAYMNASNFNLNRRANENKIRQIREEGIKSIKMNAGLYEAEHQYIQRQRDGALSTQDRILGKAAKEIKALYSQDQRLSDLHENENLFLNVEISFNRKRKGGDIGQVRAQKIAKEIIDSDQEGFVIETFKGQKITHDEIVLKKNVNLPIHGKSFQYLDAWRELKVFKDELIAADLISR